MSVNINNKELFKVEVESGELSITDLVDIKNYYEACCTAEYLMDNYDIESEEKAIELGYRVRERMDDARSNDYGMEEAEAIYEVMSEDDTDTITMKKDSKGKQKGEER